MQEGAAGVARTTNRALLATMLVTALVATSAVVAWSERNPLAAHWDESDYLNRVTQQVQDAHARGLMRAAYSVLYTDQVRPPAYRLVALPVAYAFGPDLAVLRYLCLLGLLASAVLVWLAARLVSEQPLAIAVTALFALSYAPLWASAYFGTDAWLYLATSGLFYCVLYCAVRPLTARAGVLVWAGLAAAVALGALSKTSFALLGGPAVLAFLAAGWWQGIPRRRLVLIGTGSIAGLLVAAPWWLLNYRSAFYLARFASNFVRHDFPWLPESFWHLAGPPFAALLVIGLFAAARRADLVRQSMSPQSLVILVTCGAGVVPLLAAHILGANHNMRLVSPALIPALLGLAVLAQMAGLARVRGTAVVAGAAILLQGAYMTNSFVTETFDEWSWDALLALCDAHQLREPVITHLGAERTFTPPAISYPWIKQGRKVKESWLWRYEQGPIDWNKVSHQVDSADVVVTAPGFVGDLRDKEELDNVHNEELVALLEGLHQFEPPVELRLGRFATRVLVFFRRRPDVGTSTSP